MAHCEETGILEEVKGVWWHDEREMQCPHLRGWLIKCCTADDTPFVVGPFMVREYCTGKKFSQCPFRPGE